MGKLKNYSLYLIILIPFVCFYGLFFKYTVDAPINDDYRAILEFINNIIATDSISEKLKLLFAQHNEHRIVYDRLWTIICYKLNGQVDFNFLALVGNLSLIGIFILFSRKTLAIKRSLFYLIPISVLVFNITFHENMTFAMATMSNLTVFLFSLLNLHFLSKDEITKKNLTLAVVFLILAVLTQASGVFLIPIGLAMLFYKGNKKSLAVYALISVIIIGLYFFDYHQPENSPKLLTTLLEFKVRALLFSFAFLGNAFDYYLIFTNDISDSIGLTTIIGFIFFMLYLYIIKTKYYKINLFVFSVMTLAILTAFITGATRSQLGLETAGSSRYRMAGILFLLSLYLWFLETYNFKHKELIDRGIAVFALIYMLFFSLRQYEYLSFREKQTLAGALYYHSGDHTKLNGFEQDLYRSILIASQQSQTYSLPSYKSLETYFPYGKKVPFKNGNESSDFFNVNIDYINKVKDGQLIEGWSYVEKESTANQKVFIGLKNTSDATPIYYSTKQVERFDLNPYFKKWGLQDGGFLARIKDSDIKAGESEVWMMIKVNNKVKIKLTEKKIMK